MDSAHQIWLAGLGAFAVAQTEGPKVFEYPGEGGGSRAGARGKAASAQIAR